MTLLRPILAICLALVLAVTSGAAILARGQTMAAGQAVICIGNTVVTVSVDANGQPVEQEHVCPDYLAAMLSWVDSPSAVTALPTAVRVQTNRPEIKRSEPSWPPVSQQARAPPFV
ncbi:hypothetical protein [Pseudoruegeria sp. HB172150]|uniref:hypothetical protein n=1 Tax=Pseudoruegeria sp. HB172150 TaxID=2721164 RepID=UPI001556098A|nr:hypothetical protein [Pseudoruegeria sp. HB172150]